MKPVRRKSKQREKIYQSIMANKAHPTAQDVYDRLRKDMPRLSLGNVYRNIAILLEEGRIQSAWFGIGTVRYDSVTGLHYHFVCERCGAVSDLGLPADERITAAARKLSPHCIRGHAIRFHGVCSRCLEAEGADKKPSATINLKRSQ